ncbi:MAG: RagB/SusD family nutrient uptake outer membrane protein [Candidatus Azobacteroides sp.]|nr:RagB/SusD family nutrient uptake outer membrane protein [Candidatus Azobacteroides sp.]
MKNLFYLFLLVLMGGVISCNDSFLDETVTTDLDYETVFSDSTYTSDFLTEIYADIGFDTDLSRFQDPLVILNGPMGGLQTACDEAQYKVVPRISPDVQFVTGTVSPVTIRDDAWKKPYENIRRVNIFFANVHKSPMGEAAKKTYKAEARFLRAWYYFMLLQQYGGIPIIGDVVYESMDEMHGERSTFEECVEYIVKECEEAQKDLEINPSGRDHGRIGIGACKGLISRVRLYAASPLFNGSDFAPDNYPKELVGYPTEDKTRWKVAMEAAQDVMNLGYYSMYEDNDPEPGKGFYQLFLAASVPSAYCGTILEKKEGNGSARERLFQPPSRQGGGGGYPYQELVDAFPMKNGKPITDPNSGYDEKNPYADRDPRFYNTIIYDQTMIMDRTGMLPINIYLKPNGDPFDEDSYGIGTPTGYYFNKMLNREIAGNNVHGGPQSRPLIRYAEILLNYAEAKNEYSGPSEDIYDILKAIRRRGGIEAGDDGMYGLEKNMDYAKMRDAIRHERRIEFVLKGHRFYDVRRWMIAETTENQQMSAMRVQLVNEATGEKTYTRVTPVSFKHSFRKAMYLWPIPDAEVSKLPGLVQNPHY